MPASASPEGSQGPFVPQFTRLEATKGFLLLENHSLLHNEIWLARSSEALNPEIIVTGSKLEPCKEYSPKEKMLFVKRNKIIRWLLCPCMPSSYSEPPLTLLDSIIQDS